MEPNHTCLLLTPLLLPLIIWLAEMLTLLRKNPLLILAVFSGFSSTCTYYSYHSSVSAMLEQLNWLPLAKRRRLTLFYQIMHGEKLAYPYQNTFISPPDTLTSSFISLD